MSMKALEKEHLTQAFFSHRSTWYNFISSFFSYIYTSYTIIPAFSCFCCNFIIIVMSVVIQEWSLVYFFLVLYWEKMEWNAM